MKNLFTLVCVVLFVAIAYAAPLNFHVQPMTAGKASLAENAFIVPRLLDTANFSPELRLPIQLIYDSSVEKTGAFGFAWRSPQLESTASFDKDGVLWVTPWGEKIKFFPKKEESSKDEIKLELYEQAKKGRGFYSPYSEWEADTSKSDYRKSGDWIFTGKKDKKGWSFVYRDFKLKRITAPSGAGVDFAYQGGKLASVSQERTSFVELIYSGNVVSSLKINGVEFKLEYCPTSLRILPKTEKGLIISADRTCLVSVKRGDLSPIVFSYDDYGFLSRITQGDYIDTLTVEHQTLSERRTELQAKNDRKVKYSGPINGRIVADNQFKYIYPTLKPGSVTLENRVGQRAGYHYDIQTGIFKIREFSGRSYTVYYFMRYDVAYLGKVRKIVDAQERDVISYRYDKLSGNVIRIRDIAGNDINFEYDPNGRVSLITRRGADQEKPEPVRSFQYDSHDNLTAVSLLDASGKPVQTTSMNYTRQNRLSGISNGQSQDNIENNNFGYPVSVTNVFGQTVRRELDRFNRMTGSTDIYGVKTIYSYTPAGLISGIERKDGEKLLTSIAVTYNGNGQPVSYVDQSGRTKKFERDEFGRVVKELFPDETEVSYAYNELGQLQTVFDQNKHKIAFDWNQFGLDARTTPAGQLTDYVHDKYGLLRRVDSSWNGENDRTIQYEYDNFDRIVKIDYGNDQIEKLKYDSWGKLVESTKNNRTLSLKYDYFGRIIEKKENDVSTSFSYNPWGQRTGRVIRKNGKTMAEIRNYDKFGRLSIIISDGKTVEYVYDDKNRITRQIVNGTPIDFQYDKYGRLIGKKMLKIQKVN